MAYECFHTIKNKREGREGLCAIKLDMHKAYDRVEWTFLKEIMLKLGFRREWVNLIMQCVSTVELAHARVEIGGPAITIPFFCVHRRIECLACAC